MIYCIEDDNDIRELVVYTLQSTGFDASGFSEGSTLWAALNHALPRLILLDIMLPGDDGLTILKKLRANAKTKDIPVIIMTAKTTEYDTVSGLDFGADDYIRKPFGMMELVARIKAVLRRSETNTAGLYTIGGISLDSKKHTVSTCGTAIDLTLKEFQLLQLFMDNAGIVLSRDTLLTNIWGYDFDGETRTVDVHIRSLRMKLGTCADHIETVRGVGYRFGVK